MDKSGDLPIRRPGRKWSVAGREVLTLLSSARSRLVADASGAPVLRDQGPIGRPRRPIAAALDQLIEAASALWGVRHQRPAARGWHESGNPVEARSNAR